MIDMISRDSDEYKNLLERSEWLFCLEATGVDNWLGIDFAYDLKTERAKQNG